MKFNSLHYLVLVLLTLFMQCDCEESSGGDECTEETHGSFFLALSKIEIPGTICPHVDLPDIDTWQTDGIFTDDLTDVTKYYISIRVEGFCDNIGKTDPFTVLYKGVDSDVEAVALNVNPSTGQGTRGFKVNNVPIDRQLSIDLRMREPCHDTSCTYCPGQTGNPDAEYRVRFLGAQTYMDVMNSNTLSLVVFPQAEVCDCEM